MKEKESEIVQFPESSVFIRDAQVLLDKANDFHTEESQKIQEQAGLDDFPEDDDIHVKSGALESILDLMRDLDEVLTSLKNDKKSASLLRQAKAAHAALESELAQAETLFSE